MRQRLIIDPNKVLECNTRSGALLGLTAFGMTLQFLRDRIYYQSQKKAIALLM